MAGIAGIECDGKQELVAQMLKRTTQQLHHTALQRVDRSASAHGLVAHVPFLDPDVVKQARHTSPAPLKLKQEKKNG